MPELPEVETVCRGLQKKLENQPTITGVKFSGLELREPLPKKYAAQIKGAKVTGVSRRGKYLVFQTSKGALISHLGMTGGWRFDQGDEPLKKHDHVILTLSDGRRMIFNDPRRFGIFGWAKEAATFPQLKKLGPEPLSESFTGPSLRERIGKRNAPIKNLLMNSEIVVGIGNIYASEILFRAGVRPTRPSGRVRGESYELIVRESKIVLEEAIARGGSSIDDFIQVDGAQGSFQDTFRVYGRDRELCRNCHSPIRKITQAGRSTYYCPKCQK